MGNFSLFTSIRPMCCDSIWYHKDCLKNDVHKYGLLYKCINCDNVKEFREEIAKRGIFISDTKTKNTFDDIAKLRKALIDANKKKIATHLGRNDSDQKLKKLKSAYIQLTEINNDLREIIQILASVDIRTTQEYNVANADTIDSYSDEFIPQKTSVNIDLSQSNNFNEIMSPNLMLIEENLQVHGISNRTVNTTESVGLMVKPIKNTDSVSDKNVISTKESFQVKEPVKDVNLCNSKYNSISIEILDKNVKSGTESLQMVNNLNLKSNTTDAIISNFEQVKDVDLLSSNSMTTIEILSTNTMNTKEYLQVVNHSSPNSSAAEGNVSNIEPAKEVDSSNSHVSEDDFFSSSLFLNKLKAVKRNLFK